MKKITKKFFLLFLTMIVSLSGSVIVEAKSEDYVTIFGEFINHNLYDFLMQNYNAASLDHFQDCYMVDMDNNSVPELLCLFTDSDHGGMYGYAAYIEYDNGFKMGKEIPFDFSDGTGATWWYQVLEKNGKFYFEEYRSSGYVDGRFAESEINQTITLNQNGIETVVYSAVLKGVTDYHMGTENYTIYVNGQKVEEFDYGYVRENFNIVADSADYNYNPYTLEDVQHSYGKDFAKFWNEKENTAIKVIIDSREIVFDQPPIIVDGRTLVPLRAIFEELGATVNWDGSTQTVTSAKDQTTISMSIGKTEMYKNDKLIMLDVVPQLVGERTLVPVRAVAEGFDCKVDWDGDNQTVIINTVDI